MMRRFLLTTSTLLLAPLALATPPAKKKALPAVKAEPQKLDRAFDPADVVDISKVEKLLVFSDGKGHYIVTSKLKQDEAFLYYGDGKAFYNQRVVSTGGSYDEKAGWNDVNWTFWDPRISAGWQKSFGWKDGKATVQCDNRATEVKFVEEAEAKQILGNAKFMKPRWKRKAYALARDREGNYFYVDNLREPPGAKAFKLYAGKKGEMKPLPLTNIVSDQEGDIFSTKHGDLRLVLDKGESSWIIKGKTVKLVPLEIDGNIKVIYSELGVYGGTLGTPCDDLL